jgi:subtilisin family serine protease
LAANLKLVLMAGMFIALTSPALSGSALSESISGYPSLETQRAIENLASRSNDSTTRRKGIDDLHSPNATDLKFKELKVDQKKPQDRESAEAPAETQRQTVVPFVAQNSMILQFQPDTSQEQVDDYIKSRGLEVVKTFPSIGAVQVLTDLNRFFQPKETDNNANETVVRGVVEASKEFKKDPRIREATPDVVLQGQADISNFMIATETLDRADKKITDWGIQDIQADQLWDMPGARDGVIFGILDVGFVRHEDLVFISFPEGAPTADHGTHVSGIACGTHSTQLGTRGVLPNCFIRAQFGDVFFQSAEGGDVTKFLAVFSQILGSLMAFVESNDDVSAFNISLGFNWKSNFGINPDAPASSLYRTYVDVQSPILVTVLQAAEKKGKIIFSAAGNDSAGLDPPINAKYASPFNWAALMARTKGIKNGIIVEAHDKDGKRAPFSNTGGNISCPGVDIVSSVAFDGQHQLSHSAYGKMSGTSMASPYCAAGLALFRLVRPKYSSEDAVDCLFKSKAKSSSNVPMLRLKDALDACH